MNYKPQFHFGTTERQTNAQVFATRREAEASAFKRFCEWSQPTDYGVIETLDPVNYKFENGKDSPCSEI